jgi:SHS2 domain-containing protein
MKEVCLEGYHELRHTSDLSIEVRSDSLAGIYRSAVKALTDQFAYQSADDLSEMHYPVHIQAGDELSCLIQLLNEILFLFEIGTTCLELQIDKLDRESLSGKLICVNTGQRSTGVKAITYHGGPITQTKTGFSVKLVFDL